MTKQRKDKHGTEFGLWLRGQLEGQTTDMRSVESRPTLESKGYAAQNLDYIWWCYGALKIMLLEEKRCGVGQEYSQRITHHIMDTALRNACAHGCIFRISGNKSSKITYFGYHIITFEKTNPEDGWTKIDGEKVTIKQLMAFLRFEWFPK